MVIWTDGSSWHGKGGWAFVMKPSETDHRCIERSGHMPVATNNQAEMTAVLEAMKLLLEHSRSVIFPEVMFITDSKYTIGAFTQWKVRLETKNKPLIFEFKKLQSELAEVGCQINMKWVRGHAGNRYNERADELAGRAMNQC